MKMKSGTSEVSRKRWNSKKALKVTEIKTTSSDKKITTTWGILAFQPLLIILIIAENC